MAQDQAAGHVFRKANRVLRQAAQHAHRLALLADGEILGHHTLPPPGTPGATKVLHSWLAAALAEAHPSQEVTVIVVAHTVAQGGDRNGTTRS